MKQWACLLLACGWFACTGTPRGSVPSSAPTRPAQQALPPGTYRIELVADADPGRAAVAPTELGPCVQAAQVEICAATLPGEGAELWRVEPDGIFTLLTAFTPGEQGSTPRRLLRAGRHLFFQMLLAAEGPSPRLQLGVSDGTPEGTRRLPVTIPPSHATGMLPLGDEVVLLSGNDPRKSTLVVVNAAGESREVRHERGPADREVILLETVGTRTHFFTCSSPEGCTLWGLRAGVDDAEMLGRFDEHGADFYNHRSFSSGGGRAVLGEVLLFMAHTEKEGFELWRTDGTRRGTFQVKDIVPGPDGSAAPGPWTLLGERLVFPVQESGRTALWISDGTPAGTRSLLEVGLIDPVTRQRWTGLYKIPSRIPVAAGYLVLQNGDSGTGGPLYLNDGTPGMLKPVGGGAADHPASKALSVHALADGRILFHTRDPLPQRLWLSKPDGSELRELVAPDPSAHLIVQPGPWDQTFVSEVWPQKHSVLDPGAEKLRPLVAGSAARDGMPARPALFPYAQGLFFFSQDAGGEGQALWHTSRAGTLKIPTAVPDSGAPIRFGVLAGAVAAGKLLFLGGSYEEGGPLWFSDGTGEGTFPVAYPSHVRGMWQGGTRVFLSGRDLSQQEGPWMSDGTPAGTVPLKPPPGVHRGLHRPGHDRTYAQQRLPDGRTQMCSWTPEESKPRCPDGLNDLDASTFRAFEWNGQPHAFGGEGPRLGEPAGTAHGAVFRLSADGDRAERAGEFPCARSQSAPVAAGARLFLVCSGREEAVLWSLGWSEGRATRVLALPRMASPTLTPTGRGVVFVAQDDASGTEPWFSDGTVEGTGVLMDIWPGPHGSVKDVRMGSHGDQTFFVASDGKSPARLWRTDGTPSGTRPLELIGHPEPIDDPGDLTLAGNDLYLTARTPSTGRELWRVRLKE